MIWLQFLKLNIASFFKTAISSKLTLACIVIFFAYNYKISAQISDNFKVVIDAAHGGSDPGANGLGINEKDINLKVALLVGELLEKERLDITPVFTRTEDKYLTLRERAIFANNSNAELFISINCNSSLDSKQYGAETFVLGVPENDQDQMVAILENSVIKLEKDHNNKYNWIDPRSPQYYKNFSIIKEKYLEQSVSFADTLQKKFEQNLNRKNRGVTKANFLLLKEIDMPAVIVQLGYLSNIKENYYLMAYSNLKKLANEIKDAIIYYKENLSGSKTNYTEITESSYDAPEEKPKMSMARQDAYKKLKENNIKSPDEVIGQAENEQKEKEEAAVPKKKDKLTYYVQIIATKTSLELVPENFNGLDQISEIEEDGIFKYRYGKANSFESIQKYLNTAWVKGYQDAYIIAYLNGKKISLEDAINIKTEK
jgi:N-acetylmuramoyl-L-alanine amidase